jgi:signal transduction histidine kinase
VATIVVVDDNAADRRLVETLLTFKGHRVLPAADSPQGIELVRRERPDLVICDILLPTTDGYELVRDLRRDPVVGNTPVIFNTATYIEREVRRLARLCGVRHVLTKPCDPELFMARIEHILAEPSRAPQARREHLFASLVPHAPLMEDQQVSREHLAVVSTKLYQKVAELERTAGEHGELEARLRELLRRLVVAQEEERRRVAADVHDGGIQVLAAVSAGLQRLREQTSDAGQLRLVSELDETIRLAAGRLRTLHLDLRSPVPELAGGLAAALREYLGQMSAAEGLEFDVQGPAGTDLPSEMGLVLYRIAQEALINVREHARASRVDVHVDEVEGGLRVVVRDNGVGFDLTERQSAPGHAELIGGWWRCASTPGEGTTVEFWAPL